MNDFSHTPEKDDFIEQSVNAFEAFLKDSFEELSDINDERELYLRLASIWASYAGKFS